MTLVTRWTLRIWPEMIVDAFVRVDVTSRNLQIIEIVNRLEHLAVGVFSIGSHLLSDVDGE